jgi:SAM-dependent methyltransferase
LTSASPAIPLPSLIADNQELLMCPRCRGGLDVGGAGDVLACADGGHVFASADGIPLLFWPAEATSGEDVTEIVRTFYEKTPFPNYDDLDSPERLREKAEQGLFARLLNEQIPHGARILECGCGTGQLSNFLGLKWGRTVFGTDVCLNSLRLARAFQERHGIRNVTFLQMNLFRPVFRPESFDLVIANGVLHHTSDPRGGFRSILACLKRGGVIIVGLYNAYGRLTTDLRRLVFRLTGDRFSFIDPRLRDARLTGVRRRAWFMDQYKHPHESKHTYGEVLRWFDESGVEFLNSIPKATVADRFAADERLLEPHPRGSALDHVLVQLGILLGGGREGGFFLMAGRKRPEGG